MEETSERDIQGPITADPAQGASLIRLGSYSRGAASGLANSLIAYVRDHGDPLESWIQIKCLEEALKQAKSSIKEDVIYEAEKHGRGQHTLRGAKFQVKETGAKYDYSDCGDVELNGLYAEKAMLDERIKAKEAFLKSLKAPFDIVDTTTGEIACTLYPPKKSSTTSVEITLGKDD